MVRGSRCSRLFLEINRCIHWECTSIVNRDCVRIVCGQCVGLANVQNVNSNVVGVHVRIVNLMKVHGHVHCRFLPRINIIIGT